MGRESFDLADHNRRELDDHAGRAVRTRYGCARSAGARLEALADSFGQQMDGSRFADLFEITPFGRLGRLGRPISRSGRERKSAIYLCGRPFSVEKEERRTPEGRWHPRKRGSGCK
jgi:hypothetical protein